MTAAGNSLPASNERKLAMPSLSHLAGAGAAPIPTIHQMVVFSLAGHAFGIDVADVREIRGWQPTTEIPRSASHMLGVINLRGAIVPVFDLQDKLGFGASVVEATSVVVVADLGERMIGVLADAVSDIVDIHPGDLLPPPATCCEAGVLQGLVTRGDQIVGLLDLASIERDFPVSQA